MQIADPHAGLSGPEPGPMIAGRTTSVSAADPVASPRTRALTVAAMRAAVEAIRAGAFDGLDDADVTGAGATPASALAGRARRTPELHLPWRDVGGPVVVVLPGHAGAGASTVALAVVEGLADRRQARVVEYADPARSGLASASTIELGVDGAWRRGRRGRADVFRLARATTDVLPPPPPASDGDHLLVVDAGAALSSAVTEGCLPVTDEVRVVVVTRLTVPGIRQTEHVLAAVPGQVWVAAIGPARWPRAVEAGCGSHLGRLRSRGRVVRVPVDRRLAVRGLTGDRLPRPVAAAGRVLAERLVPVGPSQHRRRAAPPRVARPEDTR
jgi:hypothetical protein